MPDYDFGEAMAEYAEALKGEREETWYAVAIMSLDVPYLYYKYIGGRAPGSVQWMPHPEGGNRMTKENAMKVAQDLRDGLHGNCLEDWAKDQDYQVVEVTRVANYDMSVVTR